MEIIIDKDFIMDILNGIIKFSSSEFLRKIFNLSTKINFVDNMIIIRVLLFKYTIKIAGTPETVSGIYTFEHNLPINFINQEKIPKYLKIDKNRLYLYIPENIFSKNILLKKFIFESNKIHVILSV
ncbi:hypothetical protein [Marinitoga aeolica]|uniref:Uncharacterized protein n=1 Tax=Marinitoga aeolica TaxID=2809031 RepID=A0ABY8PSZ0_9BACT|nr:hypothetical protein [Marinitoga aeolica]WGS65743.1 hypothetical protein JRV97_04105 [Marinitoga aeolica]